MSKILRVVLYPFAWVIVCVKRILDVLGDLIDTIETGWRKP